MLFALYARLVEGWLVEVVVGRREGEGRSTDVFTLRVSC